MSLLVFWQDYQSPPHISQDQSMCASVVLNSCSPFWPLMSKAPSRRSSHKGRSVGPIATNLRGLYFWTQVLIPSTMPCNSKSSCTQNLLMMKHMSYILGRLICYHKWVGE